MADDSNHQERDEYPVVGSGKERGKASNKNSVIGNMAKKQMERVGFMNDVGVSDDNLIEDGDDETWFGMGMTREEKPKLDGHGVKASSSNWSEDQLDIIIYGGDYG